MIRCGQVNVLVLVFDIHSWEFSQLASILILAGRRCRTLLLADSLEQLALAIDTPVDAVLLKPYAPRHVRSVIQNLFAGTRPCASERAQPGRGAISADRFQEEVMLG